jgi:UDP-2,3-diacylglucosamine pyrophosphatase LpxH
MEYIARSIQYQALIYYCVGNHKYWVSDKEAAHFLVMRARQLEDNTSSNIYKDNELFTNNVPRERAY